MSHRSVITEQCIHQENMVLGLKFPFLADLYGMTSRPSPLSLIPNPLRYTLEARPHDGGTLAYPGFWTLA